MASCQMCGASVKQQGKSTAKRCRPCYLSLLRDKVILPNPAKFIFCQCGERLTARGVATASKCRRCYDAERAAHKKTPQELAAAAYQRQKAQVAKACVDCGVRISPAATRCQPCQNRRQEANVIRAEHVRQTRYAKNETISRRGHHKRARRIAGAPQPCGECGFNVATVHHKDRNPANNDPSNLIWLCHKCHMQEHAQAGHLSRNPRQLFACAYCGSDVWRYVWEVPNGRAFCNKDHFRFWRRQEVRPRARAS